MLELENLILFAFVIFMFLKYRKIIFNLIFIGIFIILTSTKPFSDFIENHLFASFEFYTLWAICMFVFNAFSILFLYLSIIYPSLNEKKIHAINLINKSNYYNKIKISVKQKIFNYFHKLLPAHLRILQEFVLTISFGISFSSWYFIISIIQITKTM